MIMRIVPTGHLHFVKGHACRRRRERRLRHGYQGVDFLAALSMACPVAEMSCPAPAVVWQALRSGTAATSESCGQTDDDRPVHAGVLSALVPGLCYPTRCSAFGWHDGGAVA